MWVVGKEEVALTGAAVGGGEYLPESPCFSPLRPANVPYLVDNDWRATWPPRSMGWPFCFSYSSQTGSCTRAVQTGLSSAGWLTLGRGCARFRHTDTA